MWKILCFSINAGTHHVDVSGEPQFMERMQLEYHDLAREKVSFKSLVFNANAP